jgi:hypothetical protein
MKTIINKKNQEVIRINSAQFTLLVVGEGCSLVDIIDTKNKTLTVARVKATEWISLEIFVKNYFGYKF